MIVDLILIAVFLLILVGFLASAIRIVPEFKRLVILRLGRFVGMKGPGLVFRIPIIDQLLWVDLRESYFDVPHQTCITKDNAPTDIDFIVYYKVVDPRASVLNVSDFKGAALGISTTTLRAVIGEMMLDEVLAKRDEINHVLRSKLDEVTERWGVKITNVEIREILPPQSVQEAMIKQMAAERERRAMVTEAEGKKEAAIKVAEGEKQAAILRAEGEKQAAILRAEGERQAAILRAEGYSTALQKISEVARQLDENTMRLQYLEGFKAIGESGSTKIVIPMELIDMLREWLRKASGK
ncbi:SPFH domain-containing protein [Candidatus Methanodesulfokora washburnensis]|jgi:regulator of protease activity HflC (stomatin/prohibitin superfamily)|uniref:SPFH/Band 7/PHB domain protein n=1 Tax=Candidatus Methanodesulfokora washburnensis TaxID=2478471 RepID=A0A429GYW7_9CREN|nr:SPFH domain-containing protein [Candidatus Methanodesulfokores washburnensis]RSN79086.1 SPFH/Band 7/PHB domain protein [Candidatus Methanodesulfokores washburnensis]